jgi:hypothetical protein
MIILDTNVLSELMRKQPDPSVVQWLDRQPPSSIWITSVTLMELRAGLRSIPAGKRTAQMMQELEVLLTEEIEQRYLSFDTAAAEETAMLWPSVNSRDLA